MLKIFDCLPKLLIVSYTKELHREFKKWKQLLFTAHLVYWTITVYTLCNQNPGWDNSFAATITEGEERVTSRCHNAPWPWSTPGHSSHCYPTGYTSELRTFSLLFKVNSSDCGIFRLNFLPCLNLYLCMRLIYSSTHLFVLSQKCVEHSLCTGPVHHAQYIEGSRRGK